MDATSTKLSIKLLIDKKAQCVLFGEAGKDFVDFLFYLLSFPLGTVVKLLSKENMVGSLGKIYDSVEKMHENYMQPEVEKLNVLNPKVSSLSKFVANTQLLLHNEYDESIKSKVFYKCPNNKIVITYKKKYKNDVRTSNGGNCHAYVADDPAASCPSCQRIMNVSMMYVAGPARKEVAAKGGEGGYVKGLVTYMVMDNLEVKPMCNISSITLINAFKVKDLGDLEEREVYIGKDEAVKLLKSSLLTDKVLTAVFLGA